jgi:hypothetical protein
LSTIEEVDVTRQDLKTGHRWTVTFLKNLGNLPDMIASPYRHEEQTIYTTGGDPTPLGGTFRLEFNGDKTGPIRFDANEEGIKEALESLSTVGTVDVNSVALSNGQYRWDVMLRSNLGNLDSITVDYEGLTGSNAYGYVSEIVSGDFAETSHSQHQFVLRVTYRGQSI